MSSEPHADDDAESARDMVPVTDSDGIVHLCSYDKMGRLLVTISPPTGVWKEYDTVESETDDSAPDEST